MSDEPGVSAFTTKIVGKRLERRSTLADFDALQSVLNALGGGLRVTSGVYRFRTFEEADRWAVEQMARASALRHNQQAKTSC
jgi:hypothetical protein